MQHYLWERYNFWGFAQCYCVWEILKHLRQKKLVWNLSVPENQTFKDGGKKTQIAEHRAILTGFKGARSHFFSQPSKSLDRRASSHGLLRSDGGNLLWQHSDANVTQLLFDRLFREMGRQRGDIICRFVIMHQQELRCLWSGIRWMEREQRLGSSDGEKEGRAGTSCVQRRGSSGEIASCPWDRFSSFGAVRNDSWLFSHSPQHICFTPCPPQLAKNTSYPSTREGRRVTKRVTDTEAVSRKDRKSLKCREKAAGVREWDQGIRKNSIMMRLDKWNKKDGLSRNLWASWA